MKDFLTDDDKKKLLTLAREAVSLFVREGTIPSVEISEQSLQQERGCFVCIKKNRVLRGCIGSFTSDKPLYKLVQEMAVSAATRDPRFYPMKQSDLDDFTVEISVLSPLEKIPSPDAIEVGTHGIYIEKNFCRGVLLPQVAVEYGWDRNTFLNQTCLKAGLRADDWMEGADIYVFSADIFS
ncbi:MAG: AmmeMemoRadiSam system protein A [Desulfuromonadales bacterium]|nr:MAG: AmmeMemoRadiSam system protein A [Desulfuromonadales bacterium]